MTEAANSNINDAKLVDRCRRGDSTAMEQLILRYQDRIYNVIFRICTNNDDAAELTQETFVKIIEKIDEFEGRSSFYTWAFRIAVNLTLNYCQRTGRLKIRSLDTEQDNPDSQAKRHLKEILTDENSPDPASVAQNRELCRLVMTAMKQLDDDHRAVLVLRDIEGMNYARIADVLDIELGTVKSRLSRARNNLKKIMEAMVQ